MTKRLIENGRMLGLVAAFAVVALAGCVTTNSAGTNTSDIISHTGSQFRFPKRVGNFERVDVKKYDRAGTDMSVGYNDTGRGVALTVYVYPVRPGAGSSVEEHFKVCKAEIRMAHAGAQAVAENSIEIAPDGKRQEWRWASFSYKQEFAHREQTVASELYLFQKGQWFIKCRATYPADNKVAAEIAEEAFIRELAWPE